MKLPTIQKDFQKVAIGVAIAAGIAVTAANWDKVESIIESCSGQVQSALRQMP